MKKDVLSVITFFPEAWRNNIRLDLSSTGDLTAYTHYVDGKLVSGCLVKTFDHISILYRLWTPPALRNRGYSQIVAREAGEQSTHCPVLARYRHDEVNVQRVFEKAGYRPIFRGADGFVVVLYGGQK